jgi:hypothetical protein
LLYGANQLKGGAERTASHNFLGYQAASTLFAISFEEASQLSF